jgi:bacterioferritin
MESPFLDDLAELRRRARAHLERGAVTDAYQADLPTLLGLLNQALATELVCVLRYRNHYHMARGIHADPAKREFAEHAAQEQAHADRIAERIVQLGGTPDFRPSVLEGRSHSEYVPGDGSLLDMIREDLVAERIAIAAYTEIIRYLGTNDPTTRRLLEDILAVEEEHADDLAELLAAIDPADAAPEAEPPAAPGDQDTGNGSR